DALAAFAQFVMQFLGRTEVVDLGEEVHHGGTLPCCPPPRQRSPGTASVGGDHTGCASSCTCVTASTTMWARWSSTKWYTTSRPRRSPRTTPAVFSTRRCWLINGWAMFSASTSSCTQRGPDRKSVV